MPTDEQPTDQASPEQTPAAQTDEAAEQQLGQEKAGQENAKSEHTKAEQRLDEDQPGPGANLRDSTRFNYATLTLVIGTIVVGAGIALFLSLFLFP